MLINRFTKANNFTEHPFAKVAAEKKKSCSTILFPLNTSQRC